MDEPQDGAIAMLAKVQVRGTVLHVIEIYVPAKSKWDGSAPTTTEQPEGDSAEQARSEAAQDAGGH